MTTIHAARPLVLLALVGSLAGCVIHERDASATFFWNPAECGALGIVEVDIVLDDLTDGSVDQIIGVFCRDGGVTVEGLDPGPYIATFSDDLGYFLIDARIQLVSGHDNQFNVTFLP